MQILLLIGTLFLMVLAAEIFVNGVEWLGKRLRLGEGVVGSILAAVGTALPETMLAMVAIFFAHDESGKHIGIGAILGAPFMLSTAAFFVTGLAVFAFSRTRGRPTEMKVNASILSRDLRFFFIVYLLAFASAFMPVYEIKVAVAILLVGLYALYVIRTMKEVSALPDHLNPLYLTRILNKIGNPKPAAPAGVRVVRSTSAVVALGPSVPLILVQLAFALGLIILAANIFVSAVQFIALSMGVSALVLSLILAPLATELPEKFNSIVWVRVGKDTLAMGNISGAMVFQSSLPVAIGLLFTSWELTTEALVSVVIAIVSAAIVSTTLALSKKLHARTLVAVGLLYFVYLGYIAFLA